MGSWPVSDSRWRGSGHETFQGFFFSFFSLCTNSYFHTSEELGRKHSACRAKEKGKVSSEKQGRKTYRKCFLLCSEIATWNEVLKTSGILFHISSVNFKVWDEENFFPNGSNTGTELFKIWWCPVSQMCCTQDSLGRNWNQQFYGALTSALLAWITLAEPQGVPSESTSVPGWVCGFYRINEGAQINCFILETYHTFSLFSVMDSNFTSAILTKGRVSKAENMWELL